MRTKETNLEIKTDVIRKMLLVRAWRTEDLANAAGVSRATISRIINGVVYPNMATIAKIAAALDCTALDIVKLKGE